MNVSTAILGLVFAKLVKKLILRLELMGGLGNKYLSLILGRQRQSFFGQSSQWSKGRFRKTY